MDEDENCIQTFIYQCINCFPMHYQKCLGRASQRNENQTGSSAFPKGFQKLLLLTFHYNATKDHSVPDLLIEKRKGFICYLVKKCSGVYQPAANFKSSAEKQFSELNLSLLFNTRSSLGEPRSS